MPFIEPDLAARVYTRTPRIANGAVIRYLRESKIRRSYDVEPKWRRPGPILTSGYEDRASEQREVAVR
jgi:hypothetical protein